MSQSYFDNILIKDVTPIEEIFTLNEHQILDDAVRLFGKENILSAPVVDDENKIVGIVDILDIVSCVVKILPDVEVITTEELLKAGRIIEVKEIKSVMKKYSGDVGITDQSPVSHAISLFTKGIHRIPIVDAESNKIINILSPTSILHKLRDLQFGEKTLKELSLGQEELLVADMAYPVYGIIHLLNENSVTSIALVDDEDQLSGQS